MPTGRVAETLRRAGCEPYAPWLDFHTRYAGYHEPLGSDLAVFGIVHDAPCWLAPGEAEVEVAADGSRSVSCADVHGSYDYRLRSDGTFTSYGGGGPCESFDVKIEQNAVFVEARSDGRRWVPRYDLSRVPVGGLDALCAAFAAERVEEASDRFGSVWRGRDVIWHAGSAAGAPLTLWVAESAGRRLDAAYRG